MNARALLLSTIVAAFAGGARLLIAGALAGEDAPGSEIATQGGVFAIAIVIGYFLLRRGDGREDAAQKREAQAQTDLMTQAQADLKAARDELAIMRAEAMHARDQLVASLTENSLLHRELESVKTEVAVLRGQRP